MRVSMGCGRLATLFLLTSIPAPMAMAVTATANPSADAFVSSANASNNYGAAGALAVSAGDLSQGELDSLLRFNFAAMKSSFDTSLGAGNWKVSAVSLQLTSASPNNELFNGSAAGSIGAKWLANNTWVEGTGTPNNQSTSGITFGNLPTFEGGSDQSMGTFSFDGSTNGAHTYSLTLSSGLSNEILAGSLGSILLSPGDSGVSGVFNSRNFAQSSSVWPVLSVTAIVAPEPSTSVLVLAGAGLLMIRRREVAAVLI